MVCFHGAVLFERAHDVGDGGHLLADRHVDAFDARALLIDDGVHGDGRLADLPVANDELALAAADGHHGVDALDAHLHRLIDRLAGDHARRDLLYRRRLGGSERPLAVHWIAERVHHPAEQLAAHRHFENALRAARRHALGKAFVFAEHHAAHRIAFEVERHAGERGARASAAAELDHLAVLRLGQAVDAHDAVRDAHDGAFVGRLRRDIEGLDAAADDVADFRRVQLRLLHCFLFKFVLSARRRATERPPNGRADRARSRRPPCPRRAR